MTESRLPELRVADLVGQLDLMVVGQDAAKRAMATALHQRRQRRGLALELRGRPGHLLMIGPAGVGRTEIARRAAGLINAPFLKIDASRLLAPQAPVDGEKLVHDLVEAAAKLHGDQAREQAQQKAEQLADDRLLDALQPKRRGPGFAIDISMDGDEARNRLRQQLRTGELEDREIEIELPSRGHGDSLGETGSHGRQRRTTTIAELRPLLIEEQLASLINDEQTMRQALEACEREGIIFIADMDRLVVRGDEDDIRRDAVQRDLLSLIEGRTIHTRLGALRTEQLLFVGAGAFGLVRPSDLIPELQGRFPARVELPALGRDALQRILGEPERGLVAQYRALFAADGGDLDIDDGAIARLAEIAEAMNARVGDIGAHRLPALLAKLLEDADSAGAVAIDRARVDAVLGGILDDPGQGHLLL